MKVSQRGKILLSSLLYFNCILQVGSVTNCLAADSLFEEKVNDAGPEAEESYLSDFISSTPDKVEKPKRWSKFKSFEEYGIVPDSVPELQAKPEAPPIPREYLRQKDPFEGDRLRYVEDALSPNK